MGRCVAYGGIAGLIAGCLPLAARCPPLPALDERHAVQQGSVFGNPRVRL